MRNFRYEGERDSFYRQKKQEIVEYILDKNYGDTIYHSDLSKILGFNIEIEKEKSKYKTAMLRIKNIVLEYGYVLKSISGVGYCILKPSQISQHCYRTYVKRAGRLYDKSEYILEHTEQVDMNDDRKEEIQNLMAMNKQLIANVWDTIQESAYYSRKNYYDSLED